MPLAPLIKEAFVTGNHTAVALPSETWMARAALFELLSMGLLLPRPELGDALASGEYRDACAEVSAALGLPLDERIDALRMYEGRPAQEVFSDIRVEFTRLFAATPRPLVVPYVGVWKMQQKGASAMLAVNPESMGIERFMRRCGVAKNVAVGQANDPVDHIGTVCEFLEHLCLVQARAVRPAGGAVVASADFDDFTGLYFAKYAGFCAKAIEDADPNPFYRFVAAALGEAASFR